MYSETLHQMIIAAITAAGTLAETRVYSPEDWPLTGLKLPAIQVGVGSDQKTSRGRIQPPSFITTTNITVDFSVEGDTKEQALARIQTLRDQVQTAVLTDNALICAINQFSSVDTSKPSVTAEGKRHVGGASIDFAMEYPEDFAPSMDCVAVPLTSIGIHADLGNRFDATGTYPAPTAPPYTPAAAPRPSGPDGRDEAALDIQLPQ
ncbi:MAG TPA: hypothetical protein VK558_07895 [Patescibacteria group bacterium]|nr:hypothetical protein [Patescibacteria group bacterium]